MRLSETQENLIRSELQKRKLELYRPYPKQIEFHNSSSQYREILMMAANQCVSPWTFIEKADSMVPSSEVFFSKGANVLSWGGGSECVSQVFGGCLRGIEPAFRLVMEDGAFFDCSASHQVLCEQGYLTVSSFVSQIYALRLTQTTEDYSANCEKHGYLCGQPLPSLVGNDQESPPSSTDAPLHTLCWSHKDVEERVRQCNYGSRIYDHELFVSDKSMREALFAQFQVGYVSQPLLSLSDPILEYLQSDLSFSLRQEVSQYLPCKIVGDHEQNQEMLLFYDRLNAFLECDKKDQEYLQSVCAQFPGCSLQELHCDELSISILYPLWHPPLIGDGKIVALIPIGCQPIIDCHVPNVNNYKAAGVYHHNCGKTYCAAAQVAMHATGKYAPWYAGKRFKKAPVIWCAGVTGEVVRDTIQRLLIGDVANPGTGLIPPAEVIETLPSRGVANLVDTILVKHVSGQITRIRLKYYEQGREKFQADTCDMVWLDEEPDEGIYLESLTRTNATGGYVIMTFTPLKGMSTVVRRFMNEPSSDRIVINMTIDDAGHIAPQERQKIIDSYPAHERDARTKGIPMLGSGAIFPIADEDIMCDPFDMSVVPFYWLELGALDFGWDHPTAAVKALYNPQDDIIYITNCYKRKEATPLTHAAALKAWGNLLFAWPHDGLQHDKGSGVPLKEIYAQQGLRMRSDNARFEDGSNGVEAGIAEMLIRMETGRFKVFRHLTEWFEEKRMYHRREGKIWKEFDDLMASTRYLLMDLRYAVRVKKVGGTINGYPIDEMRSSDNMHTADYNPLSHKYIDKVLGLKR